MARLMAVRLKHAASKARTRGKIIQPSPRAHRAAAPQAAPQPPAKPVVAIPQQPKLPPAAAMAAADKAADEIVAAVRDTAADKVGHAKGSHLQMKTVAAAKQRPHVDAQKMARTTSSHPASSSPQATADMTHQANEQTESDGSSEQEEQEEPAGVGWWGVSTLAADLVALIVIVQVGATVAMLALRVVRHLRRMQRASLLPTTSVKDD